MTLAVEGDETQTGFSFRITRGLDGLDWEAVADEAVERGARMLGATEAPDGRRVPVVLDQFAAMSFLGVMKPERRPTPPSRAGPCSGLVASWSRLGAVHAGRRRDERGGSGGVAVRRRGVPSGRTELFTKGVLNGFLHNAYTAHKGARPRPGTARRGSAGRRESAPRTSTWTRARRRATSSCVGPRAAC